MDCVSSLRRGCRLWMIGIGIWTAVLTGCYPEHPRSLVAPLYIAHVPAPRLTCEQANQISHQIVTESSYTVFRLTPATFQSPGTIEGTRSLGPFEETVTVTITCKEDEVYAHGWHSLGGKNQLFPHYFYERFLGMAEAVQRGAYHPQGQTQVVIKPLRGDDTVLEFGAQVANVLPVRVEISNTTIRTYALDPATVVLFTPDGRTVSPLGASGGVFPQPPLSSQVLTPGMNLKGYLYYPPGEYAGARGVLIDQEEQEREGFDVQF